MQTRIVRYITRALPLLMTFVTATALATDEKSLEDLLLEKGVITKQERDEIQPSAATDEGTADDDASEASQMWNREHDEYVMKRLMDTVRGQFEPKTWLAFRRQVVDGLRADVVAAELGVSLGSVYMAKSRVLNALRRESEGLVADR